jgi:hypothetical protein
MRPNRTTVPRRPRNGRLGQLRNRLGSAIEKRLDRLGDTTLPMTAPAGYFYRNPILPQQAFFTRGGCRQTFRFSVFVYKNAAQAADMYDYFHQHVVDMGGDFRAFNIVRKGRVIYSADTAPAPDPNAPAVPTQDFHSLIAEASRPLPAHPQGCAPKPSEL